MIVLIVFFFLSLNCSIGLSLLAHSWSQTNNNRLTAFVVNHNVRNESEAEALKTMSILKNLGTHTRTHARTHSQMCWF
jgi:tRNA(Ile)-lysidine synthase TilS/MesJ